MKTKILLGGGSAIVQAVLLLLATGLATLMIGGGGVHADKYRFDECNKIVLPARDTTEYIARLFKYSECASCCREKGYNYFKWERKPKPSKEKLCSCTQDKRQLIQMKDYLNENRERRTPWSDRVRHLHGRDATSEGATDAS